MMSDCSNITPPPLQAVDILNLNQPTGMTFAYQREDWKLANTILVS
jgi:hypothetical protein